MEQFLKNLNNSQLEATIHMDGPMIVIAGAGSGKTRVLTYKIAYLMTNNVDPFLSKRVWSDSLNRAAFEEKRNTRMFQRI